MGVKVVTKWLTFEGLWGRLSPPRFLDCGYSYLVLPLFKNHMLIPWSV
jgi:hypothetical protein